MTPPTSAAGAAGTIVFFDYLLDKLNADEVEAVLAHELGHFRHRHIFSAWPCSLRPAWACSPRSAS